MSNQKIILEKVDAKRELLKLKVDFKNSGVENEVKISCPYHADTTPSLCLNTKKNIFVCRGCETKGTIIDLLSKLKNQNRPVTIAELHTEYNIYNVDSIEIEVVEKYHRALIRPKSPEAEKLKKELLKRGVTESLIASARLGFNAGNGRISIPVFDAAKNVTNIRFYLPGATTGQKFINDQGRGINAIYRIEDLNKYQTVWILGGEIKALASSRYLNRAKAGAISACGGEGSWDNKWNSLLQGKIIYICFDVDKKGRTSAIKLANILYKFAKEVYVVELPLNKVKFPKGDINDYLHVLGNKANPQVFMDLQANAKRIEKKNKIQQVDNAPAIEVSLSDSVNPKNVGKNLTFKGIPIAKQEQPYLTPKELVVTCDRSQKGCGECPINNMDFDSKGQTPITIPKGSRATLAFVGASDTLVHQTIKNTLGIPRCSSWSYKVKSQYSVWDTRIQPVVDVESSSNHTVQEAYLLGKSPQLNDPHKFDGTLWSDPKNQKAVLLVNEQERIDGDLEAFHLTDQEYEKLKIFRPEEETVKGINKKLKEIYKDFSLNITGIVGREDLHTAVDLTYFCPILFPIDGKTTGGWMNTLIVGDSSQGKSEVAKRLQEHYGLGEWVECKNATAPGLIGGLQQMSGTWFVTWGGIPRNDRKYMILEEAKGLSYETIRKLTELRSSGVASLDKIEQRRILARTRLLWLSNARGEEKMAEFPTGIEVVPPLIGAPEDIRRFDIVLIVDERQISAKEIHKRLKEKAKHVYLKEYCRSLVLLSWTRKANQVKISEETETKIKEVALELSSKYSSRLPILEPGSARLKVARIACSIAARLFSYQGENLIVKEVHVEWARWFLDSIYSNPYCGFDIYCKRLREMTEILEPEPIIQHIQEQKYALDLVKGLLFTDTIQATNFEDWLEMGQEEAKNFLSLLVRKRALLRMNKSSQRVYRKTPGFIHLLKELERNLSSRKDSVTTLSESEINQL